MVGEGGHGMPAPLYLQSCAPVAWEVAGRWVGDLGMRKHHVSYQQHVHLPDGAVEAVVPADARALTTVLSLLAVRGQCDSLPNTHDRTQLGLKLRRPHWRLGKDAVPNIARCPIPFAPSG